MKKIIASSAAAIALAAMPVAGTFAASNVIDTINVTVSDTCTLNRTAGEGTYSTALLPDAISENFGSSTLTATCNFGSTSQDIQVTSAFGNLTQGSNSIPYSDTAVAAGTSGWNTAKGDLSASATPMADGDDLINVQEAEEAQSATVWYSVATGASQAAGTYKGYATYTLAEN